MVREERSRNRDRTHDEKERNCQSAFHSCTHELVIEALPFGCFA